MKRNNPTYLMLAALLFYALSLIGCGGSGSGSDNPVGEPVPDPTPAPVVNIEHLGGGEATIADVSSDAFSSPSANMTETTRIRNFQIGDDFFQNPWIHGSASTSNRDGLGGLFNNNACQNCHIRDGRGHAPNVDAGTGEDGTDFSSILIRTARSTVSPGSADMANAPDSSVGGQLQHQSFDGVTTVEATLRVSYNSVTEVFADGFSVELRDPVWHLTSNYAGSGYDFDTDTVFSARVAPPMIGLGLIALIPEADILANEDINDEDGDGISGKANRVWSIEKAELTLGRFGWRAGQPSLIEQAAGAFVNDMGLTSRLHPEENCMPHQADCISAPNGNGDSTASYDYEVSDTILDLIAFYSKHLAVPQRRNAYGDRVQRGKALFNAAGCNACHIAQYTTGAAADQPELSAQTIFPYTDLLLHDMGEALADFTIDNLPADASVTTEFLANAREWRTPPLWGLGLAKTVDPNATFLHDGRARTIMEAILWHGGEAETAKQNILQFSAEERIDLLSFLNDL